MEATNQKKLYRKVLVIDDNPTDRFIAEKMIEKCGFAQQTILCESAQEALEYLGALEHEPDELPQLIFLDISMPGMDGYGFLEQYAKFSEVVRTRSIILMLTTSLHPDDITRAQNNPFVARFINKPISRDKLDMIRNDFPIVY
ncbi:response regulator [Flavobacterium nitrogenifigens]|uniref:CheY chemotaxis protein or a CheY-like REC (Receiver) domain n=2 Tax=Flavobacterium nitrogenifigens TaxID=1617283 RepID=A0A521FFQ6_9FLAO|nr:response regulator [Flavobacterium nitrogenifigens]KAF2339724.1 response regulator [Flavobacterium nitrogenifigens]SMO95012.1 CheY chemotaxis protein or a CheY-like REC (receiver) domain [Flavobacterium nitrogenifigens]